MYSRLFRRETSRRLRTMTDDVQAVYAERRFPWTNAYRAPNVAEIQRTLDVLAESVDRADVGWYRGYAAQIQTKLLAEGMPAIAIFALADLMYGIVLELLTPDQRELVEPLLHAQRRQQQDIAYTYLFADKRGA